MEPLLVLAAEWWWLAPAGAGAGALGWVGLRHRGPAGRRLELDAARHDERGAHRAVARTRAELKVARAELQRTRAEHEGQRAAAGAVPEAKRQLRSAERAAKAAAADLRARHASVQAARATLPAGGASPETMPLARLRAEHDALTARWIAYETDAALAIDHPAMSDPSSPALQVFLRAQQLALELRPAAPDARMTPAGFAAYRDAVREATRAFDAAERAARGGHVVREAPAEGGDWVSLAQSLLESAQSVLDRSLETWQRSERRRRPEG